jgi:DNA-binding phage protein
MDEMDGIGLILTHYLCAIMSEKENIHIGHLIQTQLKADKRSVGWLAREIGCTRNHVYKIFNRPSLDSDLILRISKAMNYNFFQYYTAAFLENLKSRIGEE